MHSSPGRTPRHALLVRTEEPTLRNLPLPLCSAWKRDDRRELAHIIGRALCTIGVLYMLRTTRVRTVPRLACYVRLTVPLFGVLCIIGVHTLYLFLACYVR